MSPFDAFFRIKEKTGSKAASKRLDKLTKLADAMDAKLSDLKSALSGAAAQDAYQTALNYRKNVVSAMEAARVVIDEAEQLMPADVWPVPVYADLLFKV